MRYDAVRTPSAPAAAIVSDEALLAAVVARGENGDSKGSSAGLLLLTGALFVGLGGLSWGWQSVVFIAVAIAFHEIGHVLAMRIFGYKNVRMLFVPLFGGLATGQPRELDATRNALVAIAGPVFGLFTVVTAGALALFLGRPNWLVEFAWVSLFLNAFNLLPLVPLDGGQYTNDALFSRYPAIELIFRLLAAAGLAWLAFKMEAWLLGILPLFLLLTAQVTYRRACIIRDARRDPFWQTRVLDLETVGLLRAMVGHVFVKLPPEKYQNKMPEHVLGLWLEIRKRFPGPGGTVALLLGYLLCLVVVFASALVLLRVVGRPSP